MKLQDNALYTQIQPLEAYKVKSMNKMTTITTMWLSFKSGRSNLACYVMMTSSVAARGILRTAKLLTKIWF